MNPGVSEISKSQTQSILPENSENHSDSKNDYILYIYTWIHTYIHIYIISKIHITLYHIYIYTPISIVSPTIEISSKGEVWL